MIKIVSQCVFFLLFSALSTFKLAFTAHYWFRSRKFFNMRVGLEKTFFSLLEPLTGHERKKFEKKVYTSFCVTLFCDLK